MFDLDIHSVSAMIFRPAMIITSSGLKIHDKINDCWLLIHGKVYDVTKFMQDHPDGEEILVGVSGKDCSVLFDEINHSDDAKNSMVEYYIGEYEK